MVLFRVFFLTFFVLSASAAEVRLENKIKAAYLYNFTKFIRWPELPDHSFNICALGRDGVTDLLGPLEGRKAQGKPIRLHYFESAGQIDVSCQILYLTENKQIPRSMQQSGVLLIKSISHALTVSSQPDFTRQGGMIGFILIDQRVRLQVNLDILKHNGLDISAKLLEVAEVVREGGDE